MEKEIAKGFITSKTNSLAIVFLCKLLSPRFYYKIKNVNIDNKSYVLDVGIIDILLVNTTANIILGSFNNSLNNITLPIFSNTNKH